jgi:ornithine carbamoyltransferase
MTTKKHVLSIMDHSPSEVSHIVDLAVDYWKRREMFKTSLVNQTIGILFTGPSTRTRTSFHTAVISLGANVIPYGKDELQISTGETISDTGRVLAQFLDGLVVRTNGPLDTLRKLALAGDMSVINAMSSCEHPTQVIGDMVTIIEKRGSLAGCHILYVGDGNNTAAALAYMCASLPDITLTLLCPSGYQVPDAVIAKARFRAEKVGSNIQTSSDVNNIPQHVDAVYTTRWETMGMARNDDGWRDMFLPFKVDATFMNNVQKRSNKSIFLMHDLPAIRGLDISSDVLDGESSVAFRQAFHKGTGAAASLLFGNGN